MTKEEVIAKVQEAFHGIPRPAEFGRGTCHCDECMEHNRTLESNSPDTMSMEEFGNPGWDPICFANDQAFLYYLPGMIRLAFGHDCYLGQLLFHLTVPRRLDALDKKQVEAVLDALWVLFEAGADEIAQGLEVHYLDDALRKLKSARAALGADASPVPPSHIEELKRRMESYAAHPEDVLTLEELLEGIETPE